MNPDREHKNELLQIKKKRLQVLEKQAEGFGPLYVPPHILTEIERLQFEIRDLEAELGITASPSQASESNPETASPPTLTLGQQETALRSVGSRTENANKLRIFLCHSSTDKPVVRELYHRLVADSYEPWLDEEDLLPGQTWESAITKAVRASDIVIVCLSRAAVMTVGFRHKEIKIALDVADMQPEGTIYIIPLKLEECDIPDRLHQWQWVNYFEPRGYDRLIKALQVRGS